VFSERGHVSLGNLVSGWTCHAFVPLRLLTYAAFASKAKGLFQPSAEYLRRGL